MPQWAGVSRVGITNYYAGIDVSLKEISVRMVDAKGKVVREVKVASEPEADYRIYYAILSAADAAGRG